MKDRGGCPDTYAELSCSVITKTEHDPDGGKMRNMLANLRYFREQLHHTKHFE